MKALPCENCGRSGAKRRRVGLSIFELCGPCARELAKALGLLS